MSDARKNLGDLIKHASDSTGEFFDIDSLDHKTQLERLRTERYRADTLSRKWLAEWAAVVVTLWLVATIIIICCNSSKNLQLTDTVLSVLLGTTTLNVLGLMFIVLKGYFKGADENTPR